MPCQKGKCGIYFCSFQIDSLTALRYHILQIGGEGIKIEVLKKEIEQLQKDRAAELKELVYLRWSNACLRHELMRNQAQEEQQDQEKNNNLATDFEGSGEIADYGLASMVLEHNEPCFGIVSGDQACSERQKLFQRLRRLVEGSDKAKGRRLGEKERNEEVKCFGRHSVSADAEAHHIARSSCASA